MQNLPFSDPPINATDVVNSTAIPESNNPLKAA